MRIYRVYNASNEEFYFDTVAAARVFAQKTADKLKTPTSIETLVTKDVTQRQLLFSVLNGGPDAIFAAGSISHTVPPRKRKRRRVSIDAVA